MSDSKTPKSDAILNDDIREFTTLYKDATEMDKQFRTQIIDLRHTINMATERLGIEPESRHTDMKMREVLMSLIDKYFLMPPLPKNAPGNPEMVEINLDHLIILLGLLANYRQEIIYWVEGDGEKYLNYRSDFDAIAAGVKHITTALTYGRKK